MGRTQLEGVWKQSAEKKILTEDGGRTIARGIFPLWMEQIWTVTVNMFNKKSRTDYTGRLCGAKLLTVEHQVAKCYTAPRTWALVNTLMKLWGP